MVERDFAVMDFQQLAIWQRNIDEKIRVILSG
jgi:hypothetical protein